MNYSFIKQLVDNGYSEEELIASLSKSLPRLAKKAQKMFMGGWSASDVLNLFSKDKEAEKVSRKSLKPVTPTEIADMRLRNSYLNIPKGSSEQSKETMQDLTKKAAPFALGAIAAPLAGPVAEAALSRALPKAPDLLKKIGAFGLQTAIGGTSQQPPSNLETNPSQNLTESQNVAPQQPPVNVSTNISQPTEPMQSEENINKNEFLETPIGQLLEVPKKGSTVASPMGVGKLLESRNGKSLIEIDGKKHQVNEDELETSPLPEKELDELYDDLLRGIEGETGEDVSRMVQWAGYNPETNTLQFLPHTGKLYKYGNISPEDAALLRDILSVRKTSGENFIGAWKKDSKSPIGAALSKLIRKLQAERGGKGNEYEETHEPIYSAYEPAIQAKKKKKKK